MRFSAAYRRPKKLLGKRQTVGLAVICIVCLVSGAYLLLLVLTPSIPLLNPIRPLSIKALAAPTMAQDRVYIPKIGVNVALVTGGKESLEKGAWHRYPERGDPVKGGNFIISAHRFNIGLTPQRTKAKSPFYHVEKLAVGDEILVDFQGKRYRYQITEKRKVVPTQIEIEAPTSEAHITLYTCTIKGSRDGRDVIFAKRV